MRGRPGRGAAFGLVVGAVLVAAVIWLPAALAGDFYEFTDPLVYMGLPMLTVCVAVGALIGVAAAPVSDDGAPVPTRGNGRAGRAAIAVIALTAAVCAVGFFLFAIGAL
jgi:hypothetical protein